MNSVQQKRLYNLLSLLLSLVIFQYSHALDASFTFAVDKETGTESRPLPLSQKQRNRYTQLDQAISKAPNPHETLSQVAKANGMSSKELADILHRNRRDMQMSGVLGDQAAGYGFGSSASLAHKAVLGLVKITYSHGRWFSAILCVLLLVTYMYASAVRNGVRIPNIPFVSSGHSTFVSPPTSYLHRYLTAESFTLLERSLPRTLEQKYLEQSWKGTDVGEIDCDGVEVTISKLTKIEQKTLEMVVTARIRLPSEVFLTDDDTKELAWEHAMSLSFNSMRTVLCARRFSDFVETPNDIRFFSPWVSNWSRRKGEGAVLVVQSMGSLKRYGIQPLRLTWENQTQDSTVLVYSTLKGGHYDGELIIRGDVNHEHDSVFLSATLLIPKEGRSLSIKLATKLLCTVVQSIAISSMMEGKKTFCRRLNSTEFWVGSNNREIKKHRFEFETFRKMQEMAHDRKRQW